MDDSSLMRRRQRFADLAGVVESTRWWELADELTQWLSLHILRNDVLDAFRFTERINRKNVGMVESRCCYDFTAQAFQRSVAAGDGRRKDFNGDFPAQIGIARKIDLTHTAATQQFKNFIRAQHLRYGEFLHEHLSGLSQIFQLSGILPVAQKAGCFFVNGGVV